MLRISATRRLGLQLTIVSVICVEAMFAQMSNPYPNAVTDRLIHLETPMTPPPVNVVFNDPDFGSRMVRATDETTNFVHPGTYVRTAVHMCPCFETASGRLRWRVKSDNHEKRSLVLLCLMNRGMK